MWTNKLILAVIVGALVGCGNSDDTTQSNINEDQKQDVEIQFSARVGNEEITCQTMTSVVGMNNINPQFKDARMYVSEVALINNEGEAVNITLIQDNKWQYENVALLDFETGKDGCDNGNTALNHVVKGTVPIGDYNGIQFTLGVPAAFNHYGIDGDDAVSPLNVMGMNWSWQMGHKHLRMDVDGFNLHLGTTGCELVDVNDESVDCTSARPNRPDYQWDNFDPSKDRIVFDYQKLVANSDITASAKSCMSGNEDPDCQSIFDNLGLDLNSGLCAGGDCSAAQTWVTVE